MAYDHAVSHGNPQPQNIWKETSLKMSPHLLRLVVHSRVTQLEIFLEVLPVSHYLTAPCLPRLEAVVLRPASWWAPQSWLWGSWAWRVWTRGSWGGGWTTDCSSDPTDTCNTT